MIVLHIGPQESAMHRIEIKLIIIKKTSSVYTEISS